MAPKASPSQQGEPDTARDVGTSFSALAIMASLVAIVILAVGIYFYRSVSGEVVHRQIVIATGPETGTYYALGEALQRILENTGAIASVETRITDGSEENIRLIGGTDGDVDLAFIQGDSSPNSNTRLVTTLYNEVLHILINTSSAGEIKTIYDLQGKRVALGPAGSGTRSLSTKVLTHFGIELGEDLVLQPREAFVRLAAGSIDAAFLLSAIPSELVTELARGDKVRFLSLGKALEEGDEAHALELVIPGVKRDIIPHSTYVRIPQQATQAISVTAALVTRDDIEEELVSYITAAIFENRSGTTALEGNDLLVVRKIRENYNPTTVSIPYHTGATAYYRREEPPFFVEYAEALSLGLTLMLTIYSVFIAVREWSRRRMKNRIDAYLLRVESLVHNCETLSLDDLQGQKESLRGLRRDAFSDLIAERLLADEAFTILQSHLRDELAAIEILINQKSDTEK
jgi:TRAP transporter TAXI family solute receptor